MGDYPQGLATFTDERRAQALTVDRDLPSWLAGHLVRNGPGLFEVGATTVNHWFDGSGVPKPSMV